MGLTARDKPATCGLGARTDLRSCSEWYPCQNKKTETSDKKDISAHIKLLKYRKIPESRDTTPRKKRNLMMEELNFENSLILEFDRYLKIKEKSFVLDEEDDMENLREILEKIKAADKEATIYAVTYPQLYAGIYSDNLLIYTSLKKEILEEIFGTYPSIEPYAIEKMTEEEKELAEWIDLEEEAFADTEKTIFSIYWD